MLYKFKESSYFDPYIDYAIVLLHCMTYVCFLEQSLLFFKDKFYLKEKGTLGSQFSLITIMAASKETISTKQYI